MFDTVITKIDNIAGITVCGVSVASILAALFVVIRAILQLKKESRLTKSYIEEAFNNAVFPKTIKLDLSKKIEEPLRTGFAEMKSMLDGTLECLEKGVRLVLSVLNQFSHVNRLPIETQDEIKEYLDVGVTKTMEV